MWYMQFVAKEMYERNFYVHVNNNLKILHSYSNYKNIIYVLKNIQYLYYLVKLLSIFN